MILIIGLGNPGEKYKKTRHNIGFRAIDEVAINFQFSLALLQEDKVQSITRAKRRVKVNAERSSTFNAKISKGTFKNQEIILVKPQRFMNNSGKSVKTLFKTYALDLKNLIVIHDDIDLPIGKIRIVKNRGAGGHKGVESIIKELKTKNFIRIRLGLKSLQYHKLIRSTEKFVLEKFTKDEEKIVKKVIKKTAEAIETILKQGLEKAMNKFNKENAL